MKAINYIIPFTLFLTGNVYAQVVCPGAYDKHLQGIATDENQAIYWSFTVDLVKTDSNGKLLTKITVPNHHGDLTYHREKVYVAVNLGAFNREEGADSWIYIYDAKDLGLLDKIPVPELVHGAGGVAQYQGRFFVVGGLPKNYHENYVYEYDQNFKYLKRHVIPSGYTHLGIQTVEYADGYWWFGCYGKPALLKTDKSFELIDQSDFDCSCGIAGSANGTFLIGFPKKIDDAHHGEIHKAKINHQGGLSLVDSHPEQDKY